MDEKVDEVRAYLSSVLLQQLLRGWLAARPRVPRGQMTGHRILPQAKQIKHHNGLFLIACARGMLSEAQQLLDMGAQPGTQDKGGLTSAHFAAAHGKKDVLSFLWSKGVELDGEDPSKTFTAHCRLYMADALASWHACPNYNLNAASRDSLKTALCDVQAGDHRYIWLHWVATPTACACCWARGPGPMPSTPQTMRPCTLPLGR